MTIKDNAGVKTGAETQDARRTSLACGQQGQRQANKGSSLCPEGHTYRSTLEGLLADGEGQDAHNSLSSKLIGAASSRR